MKLIVLASLLAFVAAAQDASIRHGPYLQNVSGDRAVVIWTTVGNAAPGLVQFGEGPQLDRVVTSLVRQYPPAETDLAQTLYQHRAELTGLRQGTRYRYRVVSGVSQTLESVFQTAAAPSANFDFLAFGDSGTGGEAQADLAKLMVLEPAAFALNMGDLAYQDGTFQELEDLYLKAYAALMRRVPIFPVPGNHDYHTRDAAPYLAVHDVPSSTVTALDRGRYYSFDWGSVHFVVLDTNRPLDEAVEGSGDMLNWLERDLAATRQEFRVVSFHHPAFPTANYRNDARCLLVSKTLTPILERHGVHLALMGHEHLYQRNQPHRGEFRKGIGTIYVTTGGGGSIVYPPGDDNFIEKGAGVTHYLRIHVTPHRLTIQAVGLNGEAFDQFEVNTAPRIEPNGVRDAAQGGLLLAPGGLASLYGADFARANIAPLSFPLPAILDGATIQVGDQPARLLFGSRNQINFQVPWAAGAGERQVTVTTPAGTHSIPATIRLAAPAPFAIGHASGTSVSANAPAVPEEWLTLYLTGLGATSASVGDGQPPPPGALIPVAQPVRVEVAGLACETNFAGLSPGFAGLYQINFRIPRDMPSGTHTLFVVSGGAVSAPISIAVKR